jgi:LPS-assembly lipoprotein
MINYGSLDNKMNGKYFMNSKIKSVRNTLFYTFLTLLLLQGCGFHLRGVVVLPPEMGSTWVNENGISIELVRAVKDGIRRSSGGIVSSEHAASSVLEFSGEDFSRWVATVDNSTGKVSEYALSYKVNWKLRASGGEVIDQGSIKQNDSYKYSGNEVLGKEQEERHLRDKMIKGAVLDLLRGLRRR